MEKKKMIFIHGLGGSHNSGTGLAIAQSFESQFDVIREDYNLLNIEETLAKIYDLIGKIRPNLVAGNSLGGFYVLAVHFSSSIALNPCMYPSRELGKLDSKITAEQLLAFKQLEDKTYNNIDPEIRQFTAGIFADHDELFSYKSEFERLYLQRNAFSFAGTHHAKTACVESFQQAMDAIWKYPAPDLGQSN